MVLIECRGVPADVLNPRNTWQDKQAYDGQATSFGQNFAKYEVGVSEEVRATATGPKPI